MVRINFAHHISYLGSKQKDSTVVLVGFSEWLVKSATLNALWDKPKILIDGYVPLYVGYKRNSKFLMIKLAKFIQMGVSF